MTWGDHDIVVLMDTLIFVGNESGYDNVFFARSFNSKPMVWRSLCVTGCIKHAARFDRPYTVLV